MSQLSARSHAIDTMRGITLALMIIVNMSISEEKSYAPLLHAAWHGLTLTDLVFPTFLFVVGASMSFAMDKYQSLGSAAVLKKVFTRTALIFLCGYCLYWFPFLQADKAGQWGLIPFENTRILGVLQRIALSYGLASLILHFGRARGAIVFSVVALVGYWWIMSAWGDYTLEGNAAIKLDKLVLGVTHMYRGEGVPFDPEGILGTLPSTVNVIAGYLAGLFLRNRGANFEVVAKLLMVGAVAIVIALAWSAVFPINKKLWTSSYVLCAIGIDLCVLAMLTYTIDIASVQKWTGFFEVLGKNTLFIYLLSEVVSSIFWIAHVGDKALFDWLYLNSFQWWAGDKNGSLVFAIVFMMACWCVGYIMDKKHIYIKL
jgi:predicted acyltransferase